MSDVSGTTGFSPSLRSSACSTLYNNTSAPSLGRFRIAFYNTENLFDCQHDSLKDDREFLPDGVRHWTPWRYWEKIRRTAEVIASLGEDSAPEMVGLCEVENDSVLTDIVSRSPLRTMGYRYVLTSGDDPRGIDVALLYKPSHFRLLQWEERRVPVGTVRKDAHARPVLHVTGECLSGDTLDIFVCHWPSRRGGSRASEPLRVLAAQTVLEAMDSLRTVRQNPLFVVMGDLNETTEGKAVKLLEQRSLLENKTRGLRGSYRYRGQWEQLDQMLVSPTLEVESIRVLDADYLLENEPVFGGKRPFRTFNGRRYQGGYSDHLPVVLTLDLSSTQGH